MSRISRPWLPAAALAYWLLSASATGANNPPGGIEFLYIDANVGGSSGGHVGVRLGDMVYHYQNVQGHTRLARDNWTRFRFIYNDIDNRNIHSARVPLAIRDEERIRDRLSLLFQVQNRHVDFLHALEEDERLLEARREGAPVGMPGIGFFRRETAEPVAFGDLRRELALAHGEDFLPKERRRLLQELEADRYAPVTWEERKPSADRYPVYPATFSERTRDLYARWFALGAIEEGWPLRETALVDAGGPNEEETAAPRLGSMERLWLHRYQDQLREALFQLFATPYPGSGQALLLTLARYQAIAVSLDTGRLCVLNVLPPSTHQARERLKEEEQEALRRLIRQLQVMLPGLRQTLFASPAPDEAGYHRLEVAASELREAEGGLRFKHALRLKHLDGPPEGLGYAVLPPLSGARTDLNSASETAEARVDGFLEEFDEMYGYQLITHNCVTELAKAVNSSFAKNDEAPAFGGHLEPGADQGFIPFRYFELIRQHYRVSRIATLPSYRNRKLDELSDHGEDWWAMIREGNTLSSSIYQYRSGDTAFLFFTEHAFWSRPVLGALNLGYAVTASAAGLISAPFDEGDLLLDGLKGGLFSLPELALWNIRKGSFEEMIPQAEEPPRAARQASR